MDSKAWGDDFREPTEDERSARRVVALAIGLLNARRAMTTAYIRGEFYPQMSDEAFRKSFLRDRGRLQSAGIRVVRADLPTGETAWKVDEKTSYATEEQLTPEDTLYLSCLLSPLATDPSFPYAHDLRLALTKLDRSFDGTSASHVPPSARARNRNLERIEACLALRHATHVTYERADGTVTERDIVPYGLFPFRATTYLVAARLQDGAPQDPHVYNLDRMQTVREISHKSYPTPADFDVRDFIRLPFQLGDVVYQAQFWVPERRLADVREIVADRGTWTRTGRGHILHASVADEPAASAWALAEGVRPLSPVTLVDSWRSRLEALGKAGGMRAPSSQCISEHQRGEDI